MFFTLILIVVVIFYELSKLVEGDPKAPLFIYYL